jgi:hypothetical protein
MNVRYGENSQTRCAGIVRIATRRAAGWITRRDCPILLTAHLREKSAPGFVETSIHRLMKNTLEKSAAKRQEEVKANDTWFRIGGDLELDHRWGGTILERARRVWCC